MSPSISSIGTSGKVTFDSPSQARNMLNTAHKLKISTSGQVPLTMALAKSEIYTVYDVYIYIYGI